METILTVKEESMIAVADAVREKSGTSGALSFPNGMVDAINSIETTAVDLTGYATEEYVNDAISNIEFPETDLTGYATQTYVNDAISNIEFPETDLTGYATETYVDEAIENIEFPETDLTGYATETYVDEAIAAVGSGASDEVYVGTDEPSTDIKIWVDPDEEIEFATTEYVDNAIANIDIPIGGDNKDWHWVDCDANNIYVGEYTHVKVLAYFDNASSGDIHCFNISTTHGNNFEEEGATNYYSLVSQNDLLLNVCFYNDGGGRIIPITPLCPIGNEDQWYLIVLGFYYWG